MAEDGRPSERGHCIGGLFLIPFVAIKVFGQLAYDAFMVINSNRGAR